MILKNISKLLGSYLRQPFFEFGSRKPLFTTSSNHQSNSIKVVHLDDASDHLPAHKLAEFKEKKSTASVEIVGEGAEIKEKVTKFYSQSTWKSLKNISKNTAVHFSTNIQKSTNFIGIASQILTKGYKFSRKQKDEKGIEISLQDVPQKDYIIELAQAKIQAAQWANSRGNEKNTFQLLEQAQRIADNYPSVKITVIRGSDLLSAGFSLLHAVGRASKNEPIFVCLEWKGGESQEYISLVGKGLCFDSGGLNLKPTSGISGMHNDKHGACSVLSAFQSAVKLKLKVNVVAAIGLAQNYVSANSYRPLDIIKSRKGLTVEIGNTDAEGRLVLADCMHWVQQNYKTKTMIELSTLTGAIIIALGKQRAGLFTNSQSLATEILQKGEQIEELLWHMPIDQYHQELIKPKAADITNSPGKTQGSSSQAAAFLKNFVQPGVQWAHLDIAGVAGDSQSTGYGAKLLLHYLKSKST